MRRICTWYVAPIVVAAVLGAHPVAAQIDINPPPPNVLLLLDTSGSMERLIDGNLPSTDATVGTACLPTNTSAELNRWGSLATVLTGTVDDARCYRQSRSSNDFRDEFDLSGTDPHDYHYKLPYHRLVSGTCVVGSGTWPVATANSIPDVLEWPSGAIACHEYDDPTVSCDCDPDNSSGWSQATDGLMDTFATRVRFGLMTFDSHTDGGTGVTGGNLDAATGFSGLWSYYENWQSTGATRQGRPDGCGTFSDFEVGARNPAAPPWEGRLISTGKPDADNAHIIANNQLIQKAILAMRPYGATPLAGLMNDARYFIKTDPDDFVDPHDGIEYPGPATDPYFTDGCRGNFIILLSDGEPNLDLRPACVDSSVSPADESQCPYPDQPWEIAAELANTGDPSTDVKTFVVGFGMSKLSSGADCDSIDAATAFDAGNVCDVAFTSGTTADKACCTLARVAYEGGTNQAYFADDLPTLRSSLSDVLTIVAAGSTSRTLPSFASGTAMAPAGAPAKSYEFASSFLANVGDGVMWEGVLERKRWVCKKDTTTGAVSAELEPVDTDAGDTFSANINAATPARQFYTVFGAEVGGVVYSERSIRPKVTSNDDSLGLYSGTTKSGPLATLATEVKGAPKVMGMDPTTPPAECASDDMGVATTGGICAERLMTWHLGGDNGTDHDRIGKVFGAIYHSSPVVHGNPNVFLRDESYAVFAETESTRPLMLYTATTDGQLHGFKVAPNDTTETAADRLVDTDAVNNELWSFIPPHVLPNMLSMYPGNQQILLDGQTIVKDVVFERTPDQAKAGGDVTNGAEWRSVLVASGGAAGGFYYALDITDPLAPEFLWQLSTDTAGNPLFGSRSTTPAITTISLLQDLGNGADETTEVAVAVLPGGAGTKDSSMPVGCGARSGTFNYIDEGMGTPLRPRATVDCWNSGPSRSLTIVRLSDGMILGRFLGTAADDSTTVDATLQHVVGFNSPISGTPVPYPSQTGDVSDRIYVGDADGTLWRIDLSSGDPTDWAAHLLFDAYPTAYGDSATDGEPVEIAPVVTVDGVGNTVVLFATGDQETFAATATMKTRIWSVTELAEAYDANVPFRVDHNWVIPFTDGKRVTGPIAVFDEVAYFATFEPVAQASSTNVCTDGFGSIWGVDFIQEQTVGPEPAPYPEERLEKEAGDPSKGYVHEDPQDPGVVVFGVAVIQVPSCYETESYTDSWGSSGTHTGIGASSPPQYQLVYQTGQGGTGDGSSVTKSERRVLPPLSEMARIDSWASIVE